MSDVTMDGGSDASAREADDRRLHDCVLALAERSGLAVPTGALDGASGLRATVRAARRAGLPVRRRRPSWSNLAAALPGIATFSDGSCLLVTGIEERDGASVVLLDAPGGLSRSGAVDRRRFEAAWSGDLVVLQTSAPAEGWRLGRASLVRVALGEPELVRDLCGATAGLAVLAMVPALFVQLALARVLPHRSGQTFALIAAVLGGAFLVDIALRSLASYCAARLGARMQARLTTAVSDRLLSLPPGSIDARPAGEIRYRLQAFERSHRDLLIGLPQALLDAAVLVLALPVLMVLNWPVALVAFLAVSTGIMASLHELNRLRRASAVRAQAEATREGVLLGTLHAARAVKALSLAAERSAEWDALGEAAAAARARRDHLLDRFAALAVPGERLVVLGALAAGIGVPALAGGSAAMPALLAAVLLVQRLAAPLSRLPGGLALAAEASVARQALAELVNTPRETAGTVVDLRGAIGFEHVSVRYPDAGAPSLSDVSIAVEPGTLLGIFGPSGAGKSTFAKLLVGTVAAEAGSVRLDGSDTRGLDPASLRRQVVVVSATSSVFAGTIRDTIMARKPGATFEEMTAAAVLAGADEFVDRLPRGYDTPLTSGAPSLSAGQRQRLALARALLARPAILVLDEALGALDLDLEDAVVSRLRAARLGLTTILISHRLASLAAADAVLVLDRGRVVDFGSPADLAERCEMYRDAAMREGAPLAEAPERSDRLPALG